MHWPRVAIIMIVCVGFIILGVFATRKLRKGPIIHDISPIDGAVINESYTTIQGSGERIAELFIDDMRVIPTITGDFEHNILVAPGYNIVTIRALDKFEKEKTYTIRLWGDFDEYNPQNLLPPAPSPEENVDEITTGEREATSN